MEKQKAAYIIITLAGVVSLLSLLYSGYHLVMSNTKFADINWYEYLIAICMVVMWVGYSFSYRRSGKKSID